MKKLIILIMVMLAVSPISHAWYTEDGSDVSESGITFEGATENAFETTLSITDPTADTTLTVPGTTSMAVLGSTLTSNDVSIVNSVWGVSNGITMEGATADAFESTVSPTDPTADRTITLPNASGMIPVAQASFSISKIWLAVDTDLDNGQTSEVVTVTGATTSTRCVAQITNDSTNEVSVTNIVTATDQATVQVSADPGASGADLALLCYE